MGYSMSAHPAVRKVSMCAALPLQWLLGQLDSGAIEGPSKRDVLEGMWRRANRSYSQGVPDRSFVGPDDIVPLEGVSKPRIDNVLKRIKMYSPHDTHPTDIQNVR